MNYLPAVIAQVSIASISLGNLFFGALVKIMTI